MDIQYLLRTGQICVSRFFTRFSERALTQSLGHVGDGGKQSAKQSVCMSVLCTELVFPSLTLKETEIGAAVTKVARVVDTSPASFMLGWVERFGLEDVSLVLV